MLCTQTSWTGSPRCCSISNLRLVNTLEIPSQALHLTGDTVVPLSTEMQSAWERELWLDPAARMLGPFAASATTESIKVPTYIGVPGQLAPRIFLHQDRPHKEFWDDFCAPLVGTAEENDWAPFLAWGQVACTWSKHDQNVALKRGPSHPMLDRTLRLVIATHIDAELPGPVP